MRSACVYCGSSSGLLPVYKQAAVEMGTFLARQGIRLIYGGGKVGLMGAVADAVLDAGGEVIGIIPQHLFEMEVGHTRLTTLITVDSMHARKHQMAELADCFIAMPGGIGTAEELLEVFTWLQLRIHAKPVGLLNTNNYYEHLVRFLDHMVDSGFLKPPHRKMLLSAETPEELWAQLRNFSPASSTNKLADVE